MRYLLERLLGKRKVIKGKGWRVEVDFTTTDTFGAPSLGVDASTPAGYMAATRAAMAWMRRKQLPLIVVPVDVREAEAPIGRVLERYGGVPIFIAFLCRVDRMVDNG